MIFIGVTGGIGSGKSLVCSQFASLNIPIFFADAVAKEIMDSEPLIQKKLFEKFGVSFASSSNALARKELGEIVFSNPTKLKALNAIIHPVVFDRLDRWKQEMEKSSPAKYGIIEAALVFESGLDDKLDYILAVEAHRKVRISRVVERDTSTESQVTERMKHQMEPEELAELSDFVLLNNGSKDELQSKVIFFHTLFSNLKQRREVQ